MFIIWELCKLPTPYLVDAGGITDNNAIRIGTRKTQHVKNEIRAEYPPDQLRNDLDMIRRDFPQAEIRSVTATYNCVGMVFACRRTCIEPEEIETFLRDDEYMQLSTLNEAQIGDIVIYRDTHNIRQHIGIVCTRIENLISATVQFKILSKWGPWAELIHDPQDIYRPWGTLAEVWTDRKSI
jgi:hypothetical protein